MVSMPQQCFVKDQDNSLAAEIATFEPLTFNDQLSISSTLQYAGKIYEVQQLNLTAATSRKNSSIRNDYF